MRAWCPFCCGWPGWMRSLAMPSRSHQTDTLERLYGPLSERMAAGRPRSRNSCRKASKASASLVDSKASHSARKREAWAVTVRG